MWRRDAAIVSHFEVDGGKTVEFRKRRLAADIRRVIVYATAPRQLVIGQFEVGDVVVGSPAVLWVRFGTHGLIDEPDFSRYYGDLPAGAAIVARNPVRYATPFTLEQLRPGVSVPQSVVYTRLGSLNVPRTSFL